MKRIITILAFSGLVLSAVGQTKDLGDPVGWSDKIDKMSEKEVMPGFDLALTQFEDSINDANKVGPWKFGHEYEVDFGLDNSGEWIALPNGDHLWRLRIQCPGALTENFVFDLFDLPEGAYVMMYPFDRSYHHNAYTSFNNNEAKVLGSAIIEGNDVVIEYYEPKEVSGQGQLHLGTVVHGYRSVNVFYNETEKALNSSGNCNIDVLCPLGVGWENQINSVAMILTTSGLCTGALINNHANDETPYFLTANHCGFSASWNFRFNWISPNPSCATTTGSTDVTGGYDEINGCSLRANSSGSDFGLLELNSSPPCSYTPYYAGWDATDATTVTEATGIHHPSGDIMKICREDDSPYHQTAAGAAVWYIDQWEQGVTEPGSSGSPLFDQNGLIIGQLYGGAAACSGTSNNGQYDYYGRLGVSWTGGGSNSTRLSNWLDPSGTGVLVNSGFDPCGATSPDDAGISTVPAPGTICTTTLTPDVTLRNYGSNTLTSVDILYNIDGGANSTYNWTGSLASGSSVTVTLPSISVTAGAHTLNVETNNPNATADSDASNDTGAANFIVGTVDMQVDILTDCWGSETTWTITDQGGSQVFASGGPYGDSQPTGVGTETSNFCLPDGCYTFEILDSYGDGLAGNGIASCTVDGDYTVTDLDTGTDKVTMPVADFGTGTTHDFCVGTFNIDENNPLSNISLYPNPTSNVFTVMVPMQANGIHMTITDLTGKVIDSYTIGSGVKTVNFQDHAAGVYMINFKHEGYTITKKVQKL